MLIVPNIIEETSKGIQSFTIQDSMLRNREIFLTGEINEESATEIIRQLMYLESRSSDPVTLYISSPGGSVMSGMAIYDYIGVMQSKVNTVCIGLAASMGAILFLAGAERMILPHAKVMIHDPSYGGHASIAGQNPLEIQEQLNSLMKTRQILADVIVARTGMSRKRVLNLTKKDSYFDAEEAVRERLATRILDSAVTSDGFRKVQTEDTPF